jgi:putative SOS response-associated peptidase YedK
MKRHNVPVAVGSSIPQTRLPVSHWGIRGTQKNPVDGEHMLYGFLTTAPNSVVAPVHSKAMPAILTTEAECDAWLSAEPAEAIKLQRPLPDGQLKIVASGEREDPPPEDMPVTAEPTLV